MLNVALTGGIGSGKTTVANLLVDLGAKLIDADVLAREVVAPGTPALTEIARVFGAAVADPSNGLDRAALAEIVFADPEARERLNGIIHPAVREAAAAEREAITAIDPEAIIVEDIPLLAETGGAGRFHAVIVVDTPLELRVGRLEQRGLPPEQARARIAAQASDADRLAIADILITNDAALTDLAAAVGEVWENRLLPYRDALAGRGRECRPAAGRRPGHGERSLVRVRAALEEAGARAARVAAGEDSAGTDLLTLTLPPGHPGAAQILAAAGFVPTTGGAGRYVSADPASRLALQITEEPL